jgi:hypothetical protein
MAGEDDGTAQRGGLSGRRGPLAIFSPTLRFPKDQTLSAWQHLDHEMCKAETGHVLSFMLMFLFIGYALLRSWFDAAAWLLAFNVLINGYPIMLQRYYRLHPTDGDHRVYFSNCQGPRHR